MNSYTHEFPWTPTHPFISFSFDARRLPLDLWALLGECSSKIEHVSGTPLEQPTAEHFHRVFLAKGIHATTAIEGNTLSEEQVAKRMQGELPLPPSQEYLGREIDNLLRAYNRIFAELMVEGVTPRITPADLKRLNREVLSGLEVAADVVPGQYREHVVGVADYRAPGPEHVVQLVARMCQWLNHDGWSVQSGPRFVTPILRAILWHLYIAWIHPFGDGNGRTARLVEFDILVRAAVPIVCAHLLSDHYNRTRAAYYRALAAAQRNPVEFVRYAVEGLLDMLREQLTMIRQQQVEVTWVNYVHNEFRQIDDRSPQARRRREIALALADHREAVMPDKIPSLSPKLAAMYAGKTLRTLQRDLQELRRRKLVTVEKTGGMRANLVLVLAFLPQSGAARSEAKQPRTPAA